MLQRQFAFSLCIYINLAVVFCVFAHTHECKSTWIQTLPAYAIASVTDLINSTTCRKELQNFRDAVDQRIPWSLKVLDSSGRFETGFLYGNTYWLGSRSQCLDTNTASLQMSKRKISNSMLHRDPQKEFPPFEINYFVAHFKHNSTLKYYVNMLPNEDVITLGLCLPASCAINDLTLILERVFHDKVVLINDLYSVDFQLIQIKDLKDNNEWLSSGALLFICITLAFSLFMITTGTIYDIFVHQTHVKGNAMKKNNNDVKHVSKSTETEVNLSLRRESRTGRILMCFSVCTNTRIILSTELDDAIPAFHGLKFLGMCCIIILHTACFTLHSVDNKIWLWRQIFDSLDRGVLISFAAILVDIYFFSSGCLVTYSYLKNKKKKEHYEPADSREMFIDLFVLIVKRFIRLTPAYMMAIGILQLSSVWLDKTSQFYMYERSHETCAKYWWRNLLYINNFFGFDAMCMFWSWYIANDMQFYVIAMTLLSLSTIYFYTAVMILGALLIGSVIFSGYTSYVYGIDPYMTLDERRFLDLLDVFYFPPWFRINPYIIGIITGYFLVRAKNYFILERKSIILYLCLTVVCNIFMLFVFHERHESIMFIAIYTAVCRILWVIPVALAIIACFIKYGGIVNQFLSFKGWIPLSRITYCAYLLHPIVIRTICLHSNTSIHFEYLPLFVMSMGYIVISYLCAYMLSLTMEMPYMSLMRMLIQYRNTNKRKILNKKAS